jgi:recombination protein RecA
MITARPRTAALPTANQLATADQLGSDLGQIPLSFSDLSGRLVEVTGGPSSGRSSWLARLVATVQADGETAAWLQLAPGTLYPPDLAALGVDLTALTTCLLPDGQALLKTADILLRSGGFGLVVADLADTAIRPTDGQLGRLLGLCQKHGAVLALLTRALEPQAGEVARGAALGSLVSLRVALRRSAPQAGQCQLVAEVVKDKRRGPGRQLREVWALPEDLL